MISTSAFRQSSSSTDFTNAWKQNPTNPSPGRAARTQQTEAALLQVARGKSVQAMRIAL